MVNLVCGIMIMKMKSEYFMNVSKQLKEYIEKEIIPLYDNNYIGDGRDRVEYVLERSQHIIKENDLKVNEDILYTVICFHDIRKNNNEEGHEFISAEIMYKDYFLKIFFSDAEREVIKEAIEDQRANNKRDPRNIYGKILSSASRNSSIEQCLKRSYYYGKKKDPNASDEELFNRAYDALNNKFGVNGYAKFYFKDSIYDKFLVDIRLLLKNKKEFIKKQKECLNIKN